jgi:hypothetical protein
LELGTKADACLDDLAISHFSNFAVFASSRFMAAELASIFFDVKVVSFEDCDTLAKK